MYQVLIGGLDIGHDEKQRGIEQQTRANPPRPADATAATALEPNQSIFQIGRRSGATLCGVVLALLERCSDDQR